MKKIIYLILTFALCVSCAATLASCGSTDAIEEYRVKFNEAGSYRLDTIISGSSALGKIPMLTEIDGNIEHVRPFAFGTEGYAEYTENSVFMYSKDDSGKWVRTEMKKEDNPSNTETLNRLLDSSMYKKVRGEKNTYKQKTDVNFGDYHEVTITIEEDRCILNTKVYSGENVSNIKFIISELGEVELTLPNV